MNGEIEAQRGTGFVLRKGDVLTLIDPEGQQVSDLFCFDHDDPRDALSAGRSIDYNETIAFTTGHALWSNAGNVLLRIVEDTCGSHDFLVTPCSLQMFRMIAQNDAYHRSCLENLGEAFAPFGITPDRVGTTFNAFMNVAVAADGRVRVLPPKSQAGDLIRFEAERALIVGITACSDEMSNGGRCKPIRFEIQGAHAACTLASRDSLRAIVPSR